MCGFVGIVGVERAAPALAVALQAIQHRGQDAAGLGTFDGEHFHLAKDMGLIPAALPRQVVRQMPGSAGIAHVRYPTAGAEATARDAQPFLTRRPGILLAHNGNVTNVPELARDLRTQGWVVLSHCDAEPILLVMADALTRRRPADHTQADVVAAVREVYSRVRGGYSVVAVLQVDGRPTLVAYRDPHGIRPGVYGQREGGAWMAASESVALDVLGFKMTSHLPPGAVVFMREGEAPIVTPVAPPEPRHCVFERVYFARPDSMMEDGRVNRTRWRMGRALAREWKARGFEADVIVAVPDTSRPAAMAMAEELGIKNREGFIKNRYSGRTFIMPDAETRDAALRLKLNPIREMFSGQRVLLVDDSIVRGTTMRRIVAMLRDLDPKELHVAVFSPPVREPCFYGIDMPTKEELVAAHIAPEHVQSELANQIGADSLTFLSLEGLAETCGPNMCAACFDGDYVVPVSEDERASIRGERRAP